jgi:hypothetical protein
MLNRILYTLFLVANLSILDAQEFGLHFMPEVWQANQTNPAFVPSHTFILSFPGVAAGASHTGFAYGDAIRKEGNSNILDLDQVIGGLKPNNYLGSSVQLETLTAIFGANGWRVTLGHSIRQHTTMNYSKAMMELGWNGNGAFLGETVEIGPGFESTTFSETKIGFAMHQGKWSIGGRVKLLSGLFTTVTERDFASVYTDEEYYKVRLQTDYVFNMAGASDFGDIDDFNFDNFNISGSNLFGPNFGLGLDLGAMYHYSDQLTFSFSLTDLGSINWKENTYNYTSRGEYEYEGLDISEIIRDDEYEFDDVTDTLETIFDFTETRNGFSTALPTKLYAGVNYELNKFFSFGGILYAERRLGKVIPGGALSARTHLGNSFHAGLTYGYFHGMHNIGANASLQFGPMQIFAVTDNLPGIINPVNARFANARVGLNWVFGYGKAKAKARKCESRWMPHTDKM